MAFFTRRAHTYTKNGKTFKRSAAKVQYTPAQKVAAYDDSWDWLLDPDPSDQADLYNAKVSAIEAAEDAHFESIRAARQAGCKHHRSFDINCGSCRNTDSRATPDVASGPVLDVEKPHVSRFPDETTHRVTLDAEAARGLGKDWKAGDRVCSYHGTGYERGCKGCHDEDFQEPWQSPDWSWE